MLNFKPKLIKDIDTNVYMQSLKGLVTHIEKRTGLGLQAVTLTGWINKGRFEIKRFDGRKKYISLQEVLK